MRSEHPADGTSEAQAPGGHRRGGVRPARRSTFAGLVALNAALLGVLGTMTFMKPAEAQSGAARADGSYLLVATESQTSEPHIWVVDTVNKQMVLLGYNESGDRAEVIAFRDIGADTANINPSR